MQFGKVWVAAAKGFSQRKCIQGSHTHQWYGAGGGGTMGGRLQTRPVYGSNLQNTPHDNAWIHHASSTEALAPGSPCPTWRVPCSPILPWLQLLNSFYSQLLHHIASHGYIAIAPQMYRVAGADATPEIADAVAICDWLPEGLSSYLPDEVRPDFQNVAMAGHSRGGKVAFGLVLGRTSQTTKLKISALVGIDPVDGMARGQQTQPRILTYKPQSFDFIIPSLVIGSGLGPVKGNLSSLPALPRGSATVISSMNARRRLIISCRRITGMWIS